MKENVYNEIISYIRKIIEKTEWEGKVFSVGGCVRDLTLKNEIKDIDLVVEVPEGGLRFTEWLKNNRYLYLKGNPVVYPKFGTSMFRLRKYPGYPLEAVCTRKERYPDPSTRNPETAYGSIEEDCFRRDLTINALYHNISTNEILDLAGGINDIRNKILRTTSDPTIIFEDDPLRILRIIRFWGRLGNEWKIEANILEAMKKLNSRLRILSRERVSSELLQILCSKEASGCLEIMADTGVLSVILPQIEALRGCKQGPQHFGDVFEHTLAVIEKVPPREDLRLAALLHDSGKPLCISYKDGIPKFYKHELESEKVAKEVMKELKLSNEIQDKVRFLVKNHMIFKRCGQLGEQLKRKKLRLYMHSWGEENLMSLLTLIDADNKSHSKDYCLPEQIDEIRKIIEEEKSWFTYKFPITGGDIMKIKNIKPGPLVKQFKKYLLLYAFSHPNQSEREDLLEELYHVKKNNLPKL